MKDSDRKGVANHLDLKSGVAGRKIATALKGHMLVASTCEIIIPTRVPHLRI